MFHSEKLNESIKNLEENSNGYQERANEVSSDIKALERYLRENYLGFEVEVDVSPYKVTEEQIRRYQMVKPTEESDATIQLEESLSWARDVNTKKFRLIHTGYHMKWKEPEGFVVDTQRCPLIECSLDIRFRMHERLHILVDALKERIQK